MPISFRPDATVWIWLDIDKDIELSIRPKFKCRTFTCEGNERWFEEIEKLVKERASAKQTAEFLLTYLVDWENFREPLTADALCRVLSLREMWELAHSLPIKAGIGEDDLGKSDLPSRTVGAASAPPAPADATTSQANANPS